MRHRVLGVEVHVEGLDINVERRHRRRQQEQRQRRKQQASQGLEQNSSHTPAPSMPG